MGLRDKMKKRDGSPEEATMERAAHMAGDHQHQGTPPEFTFMRSDTATMEVIQPPGGTGDASHLSPTKEPSGLRRSLSIFHSSRSRSTSVSSQASHLSTSTNKDGSRRRRLSERLHLRHQPESSDSVPDNLPDIVKSPNPGDKDAMESQWEQRATLLAGQNELARSAPGSPVLNDGMASLNIASPGRGDASPAGRSRSRSPSGAQPVSSKAIDEDIQEAIRLHEEGNLAKSTQIFGRLADSNGANNPLSQVLYGLALRCESA